MLPTLHGYFLRSRVKTQHHRQIVKRSDYLDGLVLRYGFFPMQTYLFLRVSALVP